MITCGLWCAPGKPNMQIYLRPLIDEVNAMHQQGKLILFKYGNENNGFKILRET